MLFIKTAGPAPRRPLFVAKSVRAWPVRPAAQLVKQQETLISYVTDKRSRRQTLLLGAAPVCCAACGRNQFLDRLFAESMNVGMDEYEAAIAPVKRLLFGQLAEALTATSGAAGRQSHVLEIGIGTGPNLGYYPRGNLSSGQLGADVSITGVDPNPYMLPFLRDNAQKQGWPEDRLTWTEGRAEALPLPDASVDAVVCTLVLCSVPEVPAVLQEVRRVLRPSGSFLFIEHTVAAQGRPLLRLGQAVLDPLQQLLADGCHLQRDPLPAIEAAGFASVDARRFEVEGMSLIAPHVAGIARA